MIFTAQLGTDDSAPGNIALGWSDVEGETEDGPGPGAHAVIVPPQASAHAAVPHATATGA